MNTTLTLPTSLEKTVEQILSSRRITRRDQQQLMSLAFSQAQISEQQRSLIDRVFTALSQGSLRVVD